MFLGKRYRMNKIGFGGGCHWCTEAIFQSLMGVEQVEQGWISSESPHETLSEAVIVHYDPKQISLDTLIEVHLLTHSSKNRHSMSQKYRSAVYYFDREDKRIVESVIRDLGLATQEEYITQTLPFIDFRLNEDSKLNYYITDKDRPFCQTYIHPKLQRIREKFGRQYRNGF